MNTASRTRYIVTSLVIAAGVAFVLVGCFQEEPGGLVQDSGLVGYDELSNEVVEIIESIEPYAYTDEALRPLEELREYGTNIFPVLLHLIEETHRPKPGLTDDQSRLQAAFRVLGSGAAPLTSELTAYYRSGINIGVTAYALAEIGSDESAGVLIDALSSANSTMQAASIVALRQFSENREVAHRVSAQLVSFLDSSDVDLKTLSIGSLGRLRSSDPDILDALLNIAETDEDFIVRAAAVRAVGDFEPLDATSRQRIIAIANSDSDPHIRKAAADIANTETRTPTIAPEVSAK